MNVRDTLRAQMDALADDPAVRPDHATALGACTGLVDYSDTSPFDSPDGFRAEPVALDDLGDGTYRVASLVVGTGQVGRGDVVTLGPLPVSHRHRGGLAGQVTQVLRSAGGARGRIATTDTAAVMDAIAGVDGVHAQALGTAGWVVVACPDAAALESALQAAGLPSGPTVRWYP